MVIPFCGLLRILCVIGIRSTLLNWLENCLVEHKQAAVLHGSVSDYSTAPEGVPQGSVLGPLLFLIYIKLTTLLKTFNQ